MYSFLKFIVIFSCATVKLFSFNIIEKYPSYNYVFDEFDVDKSYIYNPDFSSFVYKHEKGMKAFYRRSLERGAEVLPTMKGMLVGEGVSDLFIYLSMIESGFSNTAISPKKAVGLWQFMPATAKQYDLKVFKEYDERYDTSSSTAAAIRYLNKLHKQFGKWYLAAMAYNCGEGCVQKAIKKSGSNALAVLTDDSLAYLPKETRDYIKKILLVAMIGENISLGFSSKVESQNGLVSVEVRGGTDLKKVAKALNMKAAALKKLNIKIKNGLVPKEKKKYKIQIPMDKIFAFYLRYDFSEEPVIEKKNLISHNVLLGETLKSIADKYASSPDEIMMVNHLESHNLKLNQLLVVPVSKHIFEQLEF